MLDFLTEILTEEDFRYLNEILDYSLDRQVDLEKLQEKISVGNYLQSKLTKIIFKLRIAHAELEVEFDSWVATEIHNVAADYDGFPELLKTMKDYERELRKNDEYNATKKAVKQLEQAIKSLESKEKELGQLDWKIKGILDIHKIQHNIMY